MIVARVLHHRHHHWPTDREKLLAHVLMVSVTNKIAPSCTQTTLLTIMSGPNTSIIKASKLQIFCGNLSVKLNLLCNVPTRIVDQQLANKWTRLVSSAWTFTGRQMASFQISSSTSTDAASEPDIGFTSEASSTSTCSFVFFFFFFFFLFIVATENCWRARKWLQKELQEHCLQAKRALFHSSCCY